MGLQWWGFSQFKKKKKKETQKDNRPEDKQLENENVSCYLSKLLNEGKE